MIPSLFLKPEVQAPFNLPTLPLELLNEILHSLQLDSLLKLRALNSAIKQLIDGYLQVKQMTCGEAHSVILFKSGRAIAFGSNGQGQLGLKIDHENPLQNEITGVGSIKKIATGSNHTLLLNQNNEVWGTGSNQHHQINPNSNSLNLYLPIKLPNIDKVQSIAAKNVYSLILKHDNSLQFYGEYWQELTPYTAYETLPLLPDYFKIPDDITLVALSMATSHALLITTDHRLYGIGSNEDGKLGLGQHCPGVTLWTKLLEGVAVKAIKTNASASLIVTMDNKLMVSGSNKQGQLGIIQPQIDSFTLVPDIDDINTIEVSDSHTLILTNANKIIGFGNNENNQLGVKPNIKEASSHIQEGSSNNPIITTAGFFSIKNKMMRSTPPSNICSSFTW